MSLWAVATALMAAAGAAALGVVGLGRGGLGRAAAWRRLQPRTRRAWLRLVRSPAPTGELPGLLLDLAAGLRSGLDLPLALRQVQGRGRFGERLRRAVEAYDLGAPLDQALRVLLEPEGEEGRAVARILQVHGRVGGRLAPMLVVLAEALAQRRLLQREMAARSSEARYSALLLGSLPPFLVLGLARWAPAMIEPLWETGAGRVALAYAGLSWALGVAGCAMVLSPLRRRARTVQPGAWQP